MSKVKIVARIRPFLSSEVVDDSVSSDGLAISLIDSRNSGQRLVYKYVFESIPEIAVVPLHCPIKGVDEITERATGSSQHAMTIQMRTRIQRTCSTWRSNPFWTVFMQERYALPGALARCLSFPFRPLPFYAMELPAQERRRLCRVMHKYQES